MLIHFDTDKLAEYNLDAGSVLLVLADVLNVNLEERANQLLEEDEAQPSLMGNFNIQTASILRERVAGMMQDCAPTHCSDEALLRCATRLKEIYPKGCMVSSSGTKYPYAESPILIVKRLKLFFRKYGEYPLDKIIDATRQYVAEEKDSPYFKTLKYFICQDKPIGGMYEQESKLLNYLEIPDDLRKQDSEEEFVTLV